MGQIDAVFRGNTAMKKKLTPSDLEAEAQRLIESGQMPSLETLLEAVAQTRETYRGKILDAR